MIDAISVFKNFSKEEIDKAREKKVKERGAFKKRIILEES